MNPSREESHNKSAYFILSGPEEREDIIAKIRNDFTISADSSRDIKQVFFDTFDHRLYKKGYLLTMEDGHYSLRNSANEIDLSSPCSGTDDRPRFWRDFPEGLFREELRPVIDIRALIPIINIKSGVKEYHVVNEDKKTVVHLNFETLTVDNQSSESNPVYLLEAEPIRGYADKFNDVMRSLSDMGIEREWGNILSIALEAAGRMTWEYSSRVSIALDPDMGAAAALKLILISLLETMRRNEEGIVLSIDTEFLHDFRVAVRRTRSALTLIKGIFPDTIKKRFKTDFAGIGKKSNELRDLDIYLLRKELYTEMLPPRLRPGLEHLFEIIRLEREDAHREFVRELGSNSYKHSIESWGNFLNEPINSEGVSELAVAPIIGLAKKRIRKRYKQAVRLGKEIDETSPDGDLHALRIECKKLRYYLEFFESLFPESEVRDVISHLKILQDNLGDFNDLRVQQDKLRGYISRMDSSERAGYSIAAAGGLISRLYERQKEIRSEFSERFEEFSGGVMKELFEKLFSDN